MPKCHDGWSALSVSAFGTCFATFRKPSSIRQSFVITSSSLATKKCSSKSRNTKLCATPRKQWIYEKLHYTPTTQRRELKKTSLFLKRWGLKFKTILSYPARRACALRTLGLLLADSAVGRGMPFWRAGQVYFTITAITRKRKVEKLISRCEMNRFSEGYKQAVDKIWGRMDF